MKVVILFISIIFFCGSSFSQTKLKAYLNDKQFSTLDGENYLELQLQFQGHTLSYIEQDTLKIAQVQITHLFKQNNEIVLADKINLDSPPVYQDLFENFHHIQRFVLAPGDYDYELIIKDLNGKRKDELSVQKKISMNDFSNGVNFSDIVLAEQIRNSKLDYPSIFTKSGYDVIPMASNYYPKQLILIPYYVELYNTRFLKDSLYVIKQEVSNTKNQYIEVYDRYFRVKNEGFKALAKIIDITDLESGEYYLHLSVINRDKEVIAHRRVKFIRSNPPEIKYNNLSEVELSDAFRASLPLDSSFFYVSSLIPIARPSEVKNIIKLLKEKDNEKNFKYLQTFWTQATPDKPIESWIEYKAQVDQVQRLYATNYQMGHETDRGRVYLQYGEPNQISDVHMSPSEYPYEIWQYDKIQQFSNRRFVFYNPSNLNQDFRLLHSDMVGEIQNNRWQYELNKRNTTNKDIGDPRGTGYQEHFGGNSSLYYNSY